MIKLKNFFKKKPKNKKEDMVNISFNNGEIILDENVEDVNNLIVLILSLQNNIILDILKSRYPDLCSQLDLFVEKKEVVPDLQLKWSEEDPVISPFIG